MSNKVLCMCVALSCCFAVIQTQKINKVSVTVYYESLCPDSRKFFTSQLYPVLVSNLGEWVNLTMVPYGKANESTVTDGQLQFTCHHGPYECFGNRIHACAINNIAPNSNTEYGFNNVTVAAINCLMDQVNETIVDGVKTYQFPTEQCSTMNHVPDYIPAIDNCAKHVQGFQYLSAMGDLTRELKPALTSVPTIVFDGEDKSKAAQEDFKKALCASLKVDKKPSECKNGASSLVISTLALAIILLKQLF